LKQSTVDQKRERIQKLRVQRGDQKPEALRRRLQKVVWEEILTTRSEASLNKVLETVGEIRQLVPRISVENPQELVSVLELQNLLVVGEMIAQTALIRRESRGAHYRLEYPQQDDENWLKIITIKRMDGEMVLETSVMDANWQPRADDMGSRGWG
jgi:succinate dehydrogenase/fumarate reductase flavoprotein subunit